MSFFVFVLLEYLGASKWRSDVLHWCWKFSSPDTCKCDHCSILPPPLLEPQLARGAPVHPVVSFPSPLLLVVLQRLPSVPFLFRYIFYFISLLFGFFCSAFKTIYWSLILITLFFIIFRSFIFSILNPFGHL